MDEPRPLEWSVSLGAEEPGKRLATLAAALVVGWIGVLVFQHVVFGLVGSLAILLSTSELFLPIHFRVDEKGASSRVGLSQTALEWGAVRRVLVGESGVKLSPLPAPSRLDPFRGVTLRFAGNRDEVLAAIDRYREAALAVGQASEPSAAASPETD